MATKAFVSLRLPGTDAAITAEYDSPRYHDLLCRGWFVDWAEARGPQAPEYTPLARRPFHVWEDGVTQVFAPVESVIGYLRGEHRKTISDLSHDRCFAVLDAIGILCDLVNGRPVEYLSQVA